MTVQEYLNQTFALDKEINRKRQHIEALRNLLTSGTPKITAMPKSPSPNNSRMADIIAEIADLEKEVTAGADRLVQIKHDILEASYGLARDTEQAVIENRYVLLMQWEDIYNKMGYSRRQVLRVHDDAIKHIKIPQ